MTNLLSNMFVIKRDGRKEKIHFDKITRRIENLLSSSEKKIIKAEFIAQKVIAIIHSGITTEELDVESSKICAALGTSHYLYNNLAGKILISNLHKKTGDNFVDKMNTIQKDTKKLSDKNEGLLDVEWLEYINENKDAINNIIDYKKDYNYDYFGYQTLKRAYLITNQETKEIYERPQDILLRVASFIHKGNLENIRTLYNLMSDFCYTHASPTLFNSGMKRSQLSSCFLLGTGDNLEDITDTWKSIAMISKWGGGIGLSISNIRGEGSLIRGTNGPSSGIIPGIQTINWIGRYINQGGKRKGSVAIYLETHHSDILPFLDLKKNFGAETERARDIFLALWISDLFMKQVESDSDWYLMCPDKCRDLDTCWGEEYEKKYWKYVEEKKYVKCIKARKLMEAIFDSQIETGTPYILYKDSVNRKSNQANLGTIKCSNLCAEIVEYSDTKEHAVCNLASIGINSCLIPFKSRAVWTIYTKEDCKYCNWAKNFFENNNYKYNEIKPTEEELVELKSNILKSEEDKFTFPQIYYGKKHVGGFNELIKFTSSTFSFEKLQEISYQATIALNNVIDINFYPTKETRRSNLSHRPIGLGIQGLADTLVQMRIPFESDEAVNFNKEMMETIYYGAIKASNDMSIKRQEDMVILRDLLKGNSIPEFYNKNYKNDNEKIMALYHHFRVSRKELERDNNDIMGSYSSFEGSPISKGIFQFDMWDIQNEDLKYDWSKLRESVVKYGVRNSLVTALMPTASTSQIMSNNECFEFFTNNIYTRRTLAGDFALVNKHLIKDLYNINEWNEETKQRILADEGSLRVVSNVPSIFKELYKTIWEIKQVWVLKQAKARGPFVDQTQSMNIFMSVPDSKKLNSSLFWGWKNGLKTGMYYLRTKPAKGAIKFTVDPTLIKAVEEQVNDCEACSA